MLRTLNFNNVFTEYNHFADLDVLSGRKNAMTNILLDPENDSEIIEKLFTIIKAYTEHKTGTAYSDDKIKQTFFKIINNTGNQFDGFYKLKVRRAFFTSEDKNGRKFDSCGNIKGEFSPDIIAKSIKVDKNGNRVQVNPNYNLFLHDATGDKTVCYTGKRWAFPRFNVAKASVQVVVDRNSKHGFNLVLFKYRLEEITDLNSSAFKVQREDIDDGLDGLFDVADNFDEVLKERQERSDTNQNLDNCDDILF